MKVGDHVVFVANWHDLVKFGDVGVIEEIINEEKRNFLREVWHADEDYKYLVNFNGTILAVTDEDVVPLSVGVLLVAPERKI